MNSLTTSAPTKLVASPTSPVPLHRVDAAMAHGQALIAAVLAAKSGDHAAYMERMAQLKAARIIARAEAS